jgi:hypothetical protein
MVGDKEELTKGGYSLTSSIKKISKKVWIPVASVLAVLLISGIALAAMTITHHGSVTVTTDGGGVGTPVYTFAVYDAPTGGNVIGTGDTAFLTLGTVNTNSYLEKTVYIAKTGTGDVTVTPEVQNLDTATGTISFTPSSVTVINSNRQPIVIRFTSGSTPAATDEFDIVYTCSP